MSGNTHITNTSIKGHFIIERPTFGDERGFFREVSRLDELQKAIGFQFKPVQFNHSVSKTHVLRGIHTEPWNKLVYPVTGEVFLAFVDIREDSESFGYVETLHYHTKDRHVAVFVPVGVANSICVVGSEDVHYLYLVDDYYKGIPTQALAWNDPDLAIPWPIKNPILSQRDKENVTLRVLFPHKFNAK